VDSTLSLDDLAGAKLRIDDQYLVLDPRGRGKSAALTVSGAQLQVGPARSVDCCCSFAYVGLPGMHNVGAAAPRVVTQATQMHV
jgi:hypothetical protein